MMSSALTAMQQRLESVLIQIQPEQAVHVHTDHDGLWHTKVLWREGLGSNNDLPSCNASGETRESATLESFAALYAAVMDEGIVGLYHLQCCLVRAPIYYAEKIPSVIMA